LARACTADEAGEIGAASAVFLALTKMQTIPAKAEMAAIRKYFNLTSRYFILTSLRRSPVVQTPPLPFRAAIGSIAGSVWTCKRRAERKSFNTGRFSRPQIQRPVAKPGVAETASLITSGANNATDANPSGGASPTDASPRGGASPSRTYTTPSHANHIANRPPSRWD
jgi:hypothetical protein